MDSRLRLVLHFAGLAIVSPEVCGFFNAIDQQELESRLWIASTSLADANDCIQLQEHITTDTGYTFKADLGSKRTQPTERTYSEKIMNQIKKDVERYGAQ